MSDMSWPSGQIAACGSQGRARVRCNGWIGSWLSVPVGLLMTRAGRLPLAVVDAPVRVWAPAPLMRSVAAPPP